MALLTTRVSAFVAGAVLLASADVMVAVAQPAASIADQIEPSPGEATATLFEEDPGDPLGKQWRGSIAWRTATESPGPGQPAEIVVKADITVPDRGMSVAWTLRRDTDPASPASYLIDIVFKLTADFPAELIVDVAGVLMKSGEMVRGIPLAGLSVKVTDTRFLIGLSSEPADRDRNIHLLKEQAWFDIPIVYADKRRVILAMGRHARRACLPRGFCRVGAVAGAFSAPLPQRLPPAAVPSPRRGCAPLSAPSRTRAPRSGAPARARRRTRRRAPRA